MKPKIIAETKDIIIFQKMKNFLNMQALHASPDGSLMVGFKIISGKQYVYFDGELNNQKAKITLSPIVGNELVFAVTLFFDKERIYTIPKIQFSLEAQRAQILLNRLETLINGNKPELVKNWEN